MSEAASIVVRVPLNIRRRPGRKTVVTPTSQQGDTVMPTRADPALVKALARAFRYQRLLDEGRYASISEMAAAEKIERGYLGSLLRLTLIAPDIVEAILDGRQPEGLGLPRLLRPFPTAWDDQPGAAISRRVPWGASGLPRPALRKLGAVNRTFNGPRGRPTGTPQPRVVRGRKRRGDRPDAARP